MGDALQTLGASRIQHGPFSDRVYALELAPADMPDVLDDIERLAVARGYGKLVAKARESDISEFVARGYEVEARIPSFFGPDEPGLFAGRFLDPERAVEQDADRVDEVLMTARRSGSMPADPSDSLEEGAEDTLPGLELREATPDDVDAIASCYSEVFETYPFPIQDPAFITKAQRDRTRFFTVWDGGHVVAASSMEPGGAQGVVEMTDFATRPSHRGRSLATVLLRVMDRHAEESRIRVSFTIARAASFGMNITFGRCGYRFAGTLVNNTQIAGSIESMNVWYKLLASQWRHAASAELP